MTVPLETQYATIHKELTLIIDEITLKHNSNTVDDVNIRFDALMNQLDPVVFAHINKPSTTGDIIKLNQFLRQLLEIKNLVYEQTLTSLPILKSINQSVNMTDFEKQLAPKIDAKDHLSKSYSELDEEYHKTFEKLMDSKLELSTLILETQRNLNRIPGPRPKPRSLLNDAHSKLKDIKRLKLRTSILSEFLLSLISSLNVNWAHDEFLKKIVLHCGTVDENEILQEMLDEVSSDEDDTEQSD